MNFLQVTLTLDDTLPSVSRYAEERKLRVRGGVFLKFRGPGIRPCGDVNERQEEP